MLDVFVIGAGVTGCAVAMELSKLNLSVTVADRESDVCEGTSKANSAIVHSGYDAKPGSLKAKTNVEGNRLIKELSKKLDFPYINNGHLTVCRSDQDREILTQLLERGRENGVEGLEIIERDRLLEMEPNISDDIECALYAPTGGIVCPFNMTIAFAENAYQNGVEFKLNTEVLKIEKAEGGYTVTVKDRISGSVTEIKTKSIVNAAGVYADVFNNMVSEHKLTITRRKGEYMLLDRSAGSFVSHTIFQLPSKMGKGVLTTPTVHGNILMGPTATDIADKENIRTTSEGLRTVLERTNLSVKNVPTRAVITSFAGLRAHEEGGDFVIGEAEDAKGFFNAAGIESPGLTAAPSIAKMICGFVTEYLGATEKNNYISERKGVIDPWLLSDDERDELIKEHPEYGTIICRCEKVTEGQILDAIRRPLGARTLDGIKRRTRAGMGRCQAGFCSPKTMAILSRETGIPMEKISKHGIGSEFVVGENKNI